MPRKRRRQRHRTNSQDAGTRSYIARCTYFLKDHIVGVLLWPIVSGIITSIIYALISQSPTTEPGPPSRMTEPGPPSRFCTFSSRKQKGIDEGTVYSMGYGENVKLRLDYTTASDGKTKKVHLLVRLMTVYMWWNNENEGITFPLVRQPFAEQLVELVNKDKLADEEGFKCINWKPDDSKMAIPPNISFIDIEEKQPPPITEISTDTQYCSVSIPTMEGIIPGTVYFGDGDKLRVDLIARSVFKERHMIVNSKIAYFWNTPAEKAIKFPVQKRPPDAFLDLPARFECQKWTPDNSVFIPPENISFKEASKEDLLSFLEDFNIRE